MFYVEFAKKTKTKQKNNKTGWLQTFQDKCTDVNYRISVIYE